MYDEKDKMLREATESDRPMPFENYNPKWTKVNNTLSNFHKKSWSV